MCALLQKNPQSNAVCERMHQTVGNVLRTLLHDNPQQNIANAEQHVDEALSIAMHAMRAGVHTTLGSSPGNLVSNRDMFLNIPLPGGTVGYPAHPRLIRLSVLLSFCDPLLSYLRKIAQAQQIW